MKNEQRREPQDLAQNRIGRYLALSSSVAGECFLLSVPCFSSSASLGEG